MTRQALYRGIGRALLLALGAAAVGCADSAPTPPSTDSPTSATPPAVTTSAAEAHAASATTQQADADAKTDDRNPAFSVEEYRDLVDRLSEPDAEFFSDNFISNETSFLQVTRELDKHVTKGGIYLGVGPEQNFTYIAITKPAVAYIVDIRRDNLVLHLLYKAAFDLSTSRSHFLALLTGRPYDTNVQPPADADIGEVYAFTERTEATAQSFAAIHQQLHSRIAEDYDIELNATDLRSLMRIHRAFFKGGLDIRFSLKDKSYRKYPSLRELLAASDPHGEVRSYLASEQAFRYVQRMQRENRVVPLVGDFAGDRAMPALAAHLKARGETVASFYVSNVEQYLMVGGVWWKWQRNINALPTDDNSVFVRGYLDQGDRHPRQIRGHRTATTLHRMADFKKRKKPYPSMLKLCSDRML